MNVKCCIEFKYINILLKNIKDGNIIMAVPGTKCILTSKRNASSKMSYDLVNEYHVCAKKKKKKKNRKKKQKQKKTNKKNNIFYVSVSISRYCIQQTL